MAAPTHDLPPWARLGERKHGVWTASEALAAGLTRDDIRSATRSGRWQVVRRGVFADGGVLLDPASRAAAAFQAAGPDAVLSGRSAARLHGLPLIDDADPLLPPRHQQELHDDVVARRHVRSRPRLHVSRAVLHDDEVTTVMGLPVTTPARTLLDLPALVGRAAALCAWDAALHRHLVTRAQLASAVASRRGRRGSGELRVVLALADARAESPLETLGRLALVPVVPGLVPQVRVLRPDGRVVARVDLGDEALRLAVEGDGRRAHSGSEMVHKDRRRDSALIALGWRVERYGWYDVRVARRALQLRVARAASLGARAA